LFSIFKRKPSQDPYLKKVSAILHEYMKPMMPLQNAYGLAAECLGELKEHISNGVFQPGPAPREEVMAYYCMCSMVRESGSSNDKIVVFQILTMARLLAEKFEKKQNFTPLEKGICLFGEQSLSEYFPKQTKEDIESIKSKSSDIVFEIARSNGALLSCHEAAILINNVCANISETDVYKGGEKVLAISALTSITAYAIDQNDIDGANAYFDCVGAAMKKFVEGQMATFTDYQAQSLRSIIRNYESVVQELKEANKRVDIGRP
jgi:hypothetical protein